MANQQPDPEATSDAETAKTEKLTAFGEALWVDAMKSMGCGLLLLVLTIIVGGALAVAVIAPWGRSSFDCSIYCVIGQYLTKLFGG
ncbi:MAG: hypothetical protein ACI89J_001645 [Hyphomicrobiaceae bacterium]|jgi:hypothetical protein